MKQRKKEYKELKRQAKTKKEKDNIELDPHTVVVDEGNLFGEETHEMKARGWAYVSPSAPGELEPFTRVVGSMTTSGVAALMICKAALELSGKWRGKMQKDGDQAIRDGCAWLSHNFSVKENPRKAGQWHLYYLYGLERAGVLSLCMELGKHDWYAEGAKHFLSTQAGSGAWPGDSGSGATANTAFGILFLKRATTPIIELPKDTFTGEGFFGGEKEREGAKPGQ